MVNLMAEYSVVYVLTNPAMPGFVKIGRTSQEDTATRLAQLYTTGVPFPFNLEFACRVQNPEEVEAALHIAFAPHRVNPRREFFKIEPQQAIAILKLLHTQDATEELKAQVTGIDEQSMIAAETYRSRSPPLNFQEMGIPIGSTLIHPDTGTTITVVAPKRVLFGDEEMSLSAATRTLLGIDYNIQPTRHWIYNGKSLGELYEETYSEAE
jgi:T5orf172 domain